MTHLIGTYTGAIPRLFLPRDAALRWKTDKKWNVARKAAGMPFSPKGDGADQPDFATFTSMGADGFAIHYRLGAVGWLPSSTGGVLVCWISAKEKGTGELPTAKLAALIGAISTKRWRLDSTRVRGVGKHVLAYRPFEKHDLGSDWIELELAPGDYTVHSVGPHKTSLGKLAFVRLTQLGQEAVPPEVTRPTAAERAKTRALTKRAKTLAWANTEGGPFVCMQEKVRAQWTGGDGGDYDRACKSKLFYLLDIGKTKAIVLGYPNATTWLELGKDRGMIVQAIASNSDEQLLELALETSIKAGWKRLGTIDVGDGKLRIQDAYSAGSDPEAQLVRFVLPRGTYLVEYRTTIASSLSAQVAPVRLTKQ